MLKNSVSPGDDVGRGSAAFDYDAGGKRPLLGSNYAPGHVFDQSAAVLSTYARAKSFGFSSIGTFFRECAFIVTLPSAVGILFMYYMIIPSLYTRTNLAARPLTGKTSCFSPDSVNICDDGDPTRHYLWNLTNALEVLLLAVVFICWRVYCYDFMQNRFTCFNIPKKSRKPHSDF